MFKNFNKQTKIAVSVAIILFLGIIIYSAITLISRIGKIAIDIKVAPFTASVTLNGEKVANNSTIYLPVGSYELHAELEHFDSITKTMELSSENHIAYGVLNPNDEEGRSIEKEHLKDYQIVEGIIGAKVNADGEKRLEQYPLLAYLPINKVTYSLSYQTQADDSPQINIKAEKVYLNSAIKKLYSLNSTISIADYRVVIRDYSNPWDNISFTANTSSDPVEFIKTGYAGHLEGYRLRSGELHDDYIGVVLERNSLEGAAFQYTYRVILKKSGNSWEKLNTPYPILSRYNVSDVPSSILDQINQL